jgi:molybdopterin-guanine dinucleotide biosynthesis protein A
MTKIGSLPEDVAGYVLAGGRSTRMGKDKALLQLAGVPLVEHAVRKLRSVTTDVSILSCNPNLAPYAPLVPDLHKNRGPLGGIEASLANTQKQWVLILPVDVPFVPVALLRHWMDGVLRSKHARVALFSVDGAVQPALCMLHHDVASYVCDSLEKSRLKLFPELQNAAQKLAAKASEEIGGVLLLREWNEREAIAFSAELDHAGKQGDITADQWAAMPLWFSNLNTPDEFAVAERYANALDA